MESRIEISNNKERKFIFLDEFIYAQADSNYVDIYTNSTDIKSRHYCLRFLLKDLSALIDEQGNYVEHHITRVGRSFLIKTDFITGINIVDRTINVQMPEGKIQTLTLKRTDIKELCNQLDRDKKTKLLQALPARYRLTVPVSEINNSDDEYVDLGLPSGTLWATHNIDADNPESDGCYYNWSAAHSMNLPTQEQFKELRDNCAWFFCLTKACSGFLGQSLINSNVIFLPCAGYKKPEEFLRDADVKGIYWTQEEVNEESAYSFCLQEVESKLATVEGLDSKELQYSVRLVK